MRQTVSTVIEHTTKDVLEDRARQDGLPLSRYIRTVLEKHAQTPFVSREQQRLQIEREYEE